MKFNHRGWYGYSYPDGFVFIPISDQSLYDEFELVELKVIDLH